MNEWCTLENMNEVCEHGHQRRKCPHCESIWQDKRIAELEQELERKGKYYYHRIKLSNEHTDKLKAENKQLKNTRDELMMMVSWMKRKGSAHIHGGSVWDSICKDYPYLKALEGTDNE